MQGDSNITDEATEDNEHTIVLTRHLGHDIVKEFLIPSLDNAIEYKRVTGDFSSAFLVAAARGLGPFFLNKGKMLLITNGRFSEADAAAINNGMDPNLVLESNLIRELETAEGMIDAFQKKHIEALAWLLKQGRLEIRVSLMKTSRGTILPAGNPTGEEHSKLGIINKASGDKIAFLGGLNESMRAYNGNAESLVAWLSYGNRNHKKIAEIEEIFDTMWRDDSKASRVLTFPEACKKKLISTYAPYDVPDLTYVEEEPQQEPQQAQPDWSHQDRAVDAFLQAKNGILEMATGTGKTRTALKIVSRLLEDGTIRGVVVATVGNDLLGQWHREMLEYFGVNNFPRYRHFGDHRESDYFLETIATNRAGITISYDNLSTLIMKDKTKTLSNCILICDEIHNIGSLKRVQSLSSLLSIFQWRLGLSATPEREYDQNGNSFIESEIGPVIFRFGLEEAIKKGILCEFDYAPLEYRLTQTDKQKIQAAYARFNSDVKELSGVQILDRKKRLWIDLASIRKSSPGKLPVFGAYLESNREILERALVFVETKEYGLAVQNLIMPHQSNYHTYYGEDEQANLLRFSRGGLECLVTCQRISEGIDIRSVKNVVLLSASRARLETIQRIGRCLRVDPGNPQKRSRVVDFVLAEEVEDDDNEATDRLRFEWLTELSRTRREGHDGKA